jgi:hypothetical protein
VDVSEAEGRHLRKLSGSLITDRNGMVIGGIPHFVDPEVWAEIQQAQAERAAVRAEEEANSAAARAKALREAVEVLKFPQRGDE